MPPRLMRWSFRAFLPVICRAIWRIISYCLSRRLTSTTLVPEPAAMRFFLLEFSSAGFSRSALVGMLTGTLIMTVFGSAFNAVYLLPKFAALYGMPMEAIIGMGTKVNASIHSVWTLVLFAVVPFNLLKGVVVSALTFLLYKRISPLLHRGDAMTLKRRAQKDA